MLANRANDRDDRAMRDVKLTRGIMKNANGSCLAEFGDTRVLCTATIEDRAPSWRKGSGKGWLTAEYAMLPAAGNKRTRRETNGRNGRSMEIERLIGRSLRNVCDLNAMGGEVTMTIDCDVLQADGAGTRFRVGDAVTLSGFGDARNNGTYILRGIDGAKLIFDPDTFVRAGTVSGVTISTREKLSSCNTRSTTPSSSPCS